MDLIGMAQEMLNTAVAVYAALALAMVALLVALCVAVATIERAGTRRERRRVRRPDRAARASYGATRRRVLGTAGVG